MNSLVVFLSVVAFATAKPSGAFVSSGVLAYSSPIIAAAPAAVSHQSRLDIKSSPAVVATAEVAPLARAVVAQPTLLAAPALATAAIAPAAVSSQSRIDIKTSPAVTSTVVSAAPVAYSAPAVTYSAPAVAYSAPAVAYSAPAVAYSAPAVAYSAPAVAYNAPAVTYNTPAVAYNTPAVAYSAPAVAYGAAAVAYNAPILAGSAVPALVKTAIAAPTVPLETPEVAAARAAHLVAKAQALADAHLIRKRSVPLVSTPLLSTAYATTYAAAPLVSTYHTAPLAYSTPVAISAPVVTKALSVHPW